VGGRMVAVEVAVGTHHSKAVVVVVRMRQSDVVEFPTISSHE